MTVSINLQSPAYTAVRTLSPLERYVRYIRERYQVRSRRMAGVPQEKWTDDPILRVYKFTNVRRDWDYTSTWLYHNWYRPHADDYMVGLAAAFARFFCYVPSFQLVGYPTSRLKTVQGAAKEWLQRVEKKLRTEQDAGRKVFTSAYIIGGVKGGENKVRYVLWEYLWPAVTDGVLSKPYESLEEAHTVLQQLFGWGHFMTQEVTLDLRHTWIGNLATDQRTYAFAGPGAIRGLNRVHSRKVDFHLNQTTAIGEMRELYEQLMKGWERTWKLPRALKDEFTVHDVEFNLCEFDKYERVLHGEGTPKQLFHGPRDADDLFSFIED